MREVRTQTAKDTRRTQRETAFNKHRDLDNLSDDEEIEDSVPAPAPAHVAEQPTTAESDVRSLQPLYQPSLPPVCM